jgi:hypothetical protein
MRGTYFENPGVPTDEERGTYCPEGVKVAEFPPGRPEEMQVIEPWQCEKPWCTREQFEQARAEMEADLKEAERHAWGCVREPYHKGDCEGDRGLL